MIVGLFDQANLLATVIQVGAARIQRSLGHVARHARVDGGLACRALALVCRRTNLHGSLQSEPSTLSPLQIVCLRGLVALRRLIVAVRSHVVQQTLLHLAVEPVARLLPRSLQVLVVVQNVQSDIAPKKCF
jgi:hypothetical protein